MKTGETKKFQEINGLIIDYLSYHGFIDTVCTLEQEVKRLLNERPDSASLLVPNQEIRQLSLTQKENIKAEMITYLNEGNLNSFFIMWEKYVSARLRTSDEETIKIEFFTRLYSATLELREGANNTHAHKKNVEEFKNYIARKGNLINSPELLPFFAFPYIPDPSSHPSFTSLFQKQWKETLFARISDYLEQVFSEPQESPKLHSLIYGGKSSTRSSPSSYPTDKKNEQEFDTHLEYVQERYKELYGVSTDLLQALGGVIKGKKLNIQFLKCAKEKIDLLNYDTLLPMKHSIVTGNLSYVSDPLFAALDYNKLKKALVMGDRESVPYILQALRWRFKKTTPKKSRKLVLQSLLGNDILGLHAGDKIILKTLLGGNDPLTVEYTLRLLNSLASEKIGLQYLVTPLQKMNDPNVFLLCELMQLLKKEPPDTISRQNVIGILQKISISKKVQTKLIKLEGIETLCNILENGAENCSEYSIEYGTALLMNMCLGKGARAIYDKNPDKILSILIDLIEKDSPQMKTYVNGTLYTILNSSPILREKAMELGMEDMLRELLKKARDPLAKQIAFVLDALLHGEDVDDYDQDDTEDEKIYDDEENEEEYDGEDDEEETLSSVNHLIGEELLCSLFLASNESAREEAERLRPSSKYDRTAKRPRSFRTASVRCSASRGPQVNFSLDNLMIKNKLLRQSIELDEEEQFDGEEEDNYQ